MLIVGLTGSIGMGKSTAAARFRERGIAVFDADAAVHALYEGPLAAAINAAFPGTAPGGKVDRNTLSAALLAEPHRFKELEAIVHPRVRELQRRFVHAEVQRGAKLAVLEIPLLFEGGGEKAVDVTVVVSAGPDAQRARVLQRPGMTAAKLDALLKRQTPDADKRRRADFVVDTNGPTAACDAQVDAILSKLESRTGTAFAHHWR
jgi:dephospho-CoA kinase